METPLHKSFQTNWKVTAYTGKSSKLLCKPRYLLLLVILCTFKRKGYLAKYSFIDFLVLQYHIFVTFYETHKQVNFQSILFIQYRANLEHM